MSPDKKKDKRPACTTRKDLQCRKLKDLQPKKDKILTLEERYMKKSAIEKLAIIECRKEKEIRNGKGKNAARKDKKSAEETTFNAICSGRIQGSK